MRQTTPDRRRKENKIGKSAKRTLTPKQLHFCRCVASGMELVAAYREAYDTTGKPITQYSSASTLYRDPLIRARIDQLIAAKELAVARSAVSDRERVTSFLREMMEQGTPHDMARLRAAELLGKSAGLFTDQIKISRAESSEDVKEKLIAKLARLSASMVPDATDNIVDNVDDVDASGDDDDE